MSEERKKNSGRSILHETKSELTAEEWVSLIDRENGELSACCANIEDLRDHIIEILRHGAGLSPWNGWAFIRAYRAARDGHDESLTEENMPALLKLVREVVESMGMTLEEVHNFPHYVERQHLEKNDEV